METRCNFSMQRMSRNALVMHTTRTDYPVVGGLRLTERRGLLLACSELCNNDSISTVILCFRCLTIWAGFVFEILTKPSISILVGTNSYITHYGYKSNITNSFYRIKSKNTSVWVTLSDKNINKTQYILSPYIVVVLLSLIWCIKILYLSITLDEYG